MSGSLVYNIPAKLIDEYRGRNVIVRSSSPNEIVYCFWRAELSSIRFARLLALDADMSVLENTGEGIPLELALKDPEHFECLYNFTTLLDSHPLRIAISVVPGFSKAVKLATSLDFAVKLEMDQPDDSLVEELESVLDLYLHRPFVRHPVEFFQTILLSFYRDEPVTLWDINEENPDHVRYVTEDGREIVSRSLVEQEIDGGLSYFVERFTHRMLIQERQCHRCEFFNRCKSYFKWPDPAYRCDAIKRVLATLQSATQEVRKDLDSYEAMGVHA